MKRVAIILIFCFLFSSAFAIRIDSLDLMTSQPIAPRTAELIFKATVVNTNDMNDIMFTKLYVDGTQVDANAVVFSGLQFNQIYMKWMDVNKNVLSGQHRIDFNAWDINSMASRSMDLNVSGGAVNLKAISIDYNGFSFSPGQSLNIRGKFQSGDATITQSFTNCFYLDNVEKYCGSTTIAPNSTGFYDVNFTLPNSTASFTLKFKTDATNQVSESDETDNETTRAISTIQGVDMSVVGEDIAYDKAVEKQLMTITAIVRNLGGTTARNVSVEAFIGEDPAESLKVFSTQFAEIGGGESKTVVFNYTPSTVGFDVIRVIADRNRNIEEVNYLNNEGQKGFYILKEDVAEAQPYILTFDIEKKCAAFLSNKQSFYVDDINRQDSNTGPWVVTIRLLDSEGVAIIKGTYGQEADVTRSGVAMRVMVVDEDFARVLLVYQRSVTVMYTDCQADVRDAKDSLRACEQSFGTCQEKLVKVQVTADAITGQYNSCQTEVTTVKTNKDTISTELALCQSRLTSAGTECESRMSDLRNQEATKSKAELNLCQKDVLLAENEITGLKANQELIFTVVGLAILSGSILYLYLKRRQSNAKFL